MLAHVRLANRVAFAPYQSGTTSHDGFVNDTLYGYYLKRAHGGVGLLLSEPAYTIAPTTPLAHLGLYHDGFVPGLRRLQQAVYGSGAYLLPVLHLPTPANPTASDPAALVEATAAAAWRAHCAGCAGVVLSAADGGMLQWHLSPRTNHRRDMYGGSLTNRLRLALEMIEAIRKWLGTRFVLGLRLIAEEFAPDGISLHDARVYARRLAAAGVHLLDVTTDDADQLHVARFPAWRIPLVERIKQVVPDVTVAGSGQLGDPHLADSVIRDGSADLVLLRHSLHDNPYWVDIARIVLASAPAHAALPLA